MKTYLVSLTCALTSLLVGTQTSHAGVISEIATVNGPTAALPPLPIPVTTVFIDNDENPTLINFTQPFTALQITGGGSPVEFEFHVTDSGTGGTTEYIFNQWIVNASGASWTSLRYTLSAWSTSGSPLVTPDLDFDWPDKTTLGLGSSNFTNIVHQPQEQLWSSGVTGAGVNEITTFAIDVPDIGEDYVLLLTLEVPEPLSAISWFVGLTLLNRRRNYVTTC